MKKQSQLGKFVYLGAIAGLVLVFGVIVLEKSQISNFYTKPTEQPAVTTRPVNDIQFTPADPTDNDTTNQQKEDGTIDQTPPPPASGSPINVVLTAAGQDEASGPVVIKVLLTDVNNGTCAVKMTKDSVVKDYSATVVNAGTYYTCDGFNIPIADLTNGDWNTIVTVTSADRTGTAEQIIKVAQ